MMIGSSYIIEVLGENKTFYNIDNWPRYAMTELHQSKKNIDYQATPWRGTTLTLR